MTRSIAKCLLITALALFWRASGHAQPSPDCAPRRRETALPRGEQQVARTTAPRRVPARRNPGNLRISSGEQQEGILPQARVPSQNLAGIVPRHHRLPIQGLRRWKDTLAHRTSFVAPNAAQPGLPQDRVTSRSTTSTDRRRSARRRAESPLEPGEGERIQQPSSNSRRVR